MGAVRSKAFPSEVETASEARHWAEAMLGEMGWAGSVDEVVLLVSELVTNAVRHAGLKVRVTLYRHDDGLWVSVTDAGPGKVTLRHAEPTDVNGRGLEIVAQVSGAWGVIAEAESKSVWFELTKA